MNSVNVEKTELLGILRVNRDGHRAKFEAAQEIYRKRVIEWFEGELERARSGAKIRRHIELPEPIDYTPSYNEVIQMLEMSVNDEIKISQREFRRYVLDHWEWAEDFAAKTMSYTDPAQ